MEHWFAGVLAWLALPQYGLLTLFVVAVVSATLLPLGSEPALLGLVTLNPSLFWWAIAVATLGNTLGGAISWATGYGLERAYEGLAHKPPPGPASRRARVLLDRYGAPACLLSWLPLVGDPLCAVAGWLRLPFWPCVAYMAIGKGARYLVMTSAVVWAWPLVRPWLVAHGMPG
ncbi:MAG: YqaA family protein [Betaproteobacteria bacterium]